MPSSSAPLFHTLSPFYTPQIRDVAPPIGPRLHAVALCKYYPTGFLLPLVWLLPPGVSHVPYHNCFALFPVIIWRNSVCVPSILFYIDTKSTHISDPYNRIACTTALKKPADTLRYALSHETIVPNLPRPTLRARCFAVQPENHHPFGLGVVPDSPLSRLPPPHLGWTKFPCTLP